MQISMRSQRTATSCQLLVIITSDYYIPLFKMSKKVKTFTVTPKKHLRLINIPPAAAPPPPHPVPPSREAPDWPEDPFEDPAKLVLLQAEEAKRNRKREEMRIGLEKIHDRVKYALNNFEGPFDEAKKLSTSSSDVNLKVVDDPVQLYGLLSDPRLRFKYQQSLTLFIVGYEEKCEEREKTLASLQEFFEETQYGGTEMLLDELESEEINVDEVTSCLESAMDTAQNAAEKLLAIQKEIGQRMAVAAMYPDTKKGKKRLEKALLKSQEEVDGLTASLDELRKELEQKESKCVQLQKQVDLKTQECAKLKPMADKAKSLQENNDSLQKEQARLQVALDKAEKSLKEASSSKFIPEKKPTAIAAVVDDGRIGELERKLAEEQEKLKSLQTEMEALSSKHKRELEDLKAHHEVEVEEMRGRYEEQMKSLMEDDLFDEEENREESGGEGGMAMETEEEQHFEGDEVRQWSY